MSQCPRQASFLARDCTVSGIVAAAQIRAQLLELMTINKASIEGNLFRTRDPQALPFFQRGDKIGSREQTVRRTCIQPSESAAHLLDRQKTAPEIGLIDVRDLKLAARGGTKIGRDIDHLAVVEIQSRDGEIGLWRLRLFLDRCRPARLVKATTP